MDENPNDSGENNPGAEPIVAPDEIDNEKKPETEMPEAASISDSEPEPGSMEPETSEPTRITVSEPEPEPISEPAPIPTPEPAPTPMQPTMDPTIKKKGHGGLIALAVIAILLVIAGVVICVILLNSGTEKPNTANKPVEQPVVVEEISTAVCTVENETWNYDLSVSIEENSLEVKKISGKLELLDGYNAETLAEEEKSLIASIVEAFSKYDADEDGITVTTTGSFEAGAGYSISVQVDREKITDEELLKNIKEDLDGVSAEEYARSISGENSDGTIIVCTVE